MFEGQVVLLNAETTEALWGQVVKGSRGPHAAPQPGAPEDATAESLALRTMCEEDRDEGVESRSLALMCLGPLETKVRGSESAVR